MGRREACLDEFVVTEERGFLPLHDPLDKLPDEYSELERLMQDLPGVLKERNEIMRRTKEMPFYHPTEGSIEPRLALALLRDYSFWASAYCLEPCHWHRLDRHVQRVVGGGCDSDGCFENEYGLARDSLPEKIATPLRHLALLFGTSPWLEYAHAYALANYRLKDPNAGKQQKHVFFDD